MVLMFGCTWSVTGKVMEGRTGRARCVWELGGAAGVLGGGDLYPMDKREDGELPRLGNWLDMGAKCREE